MLKIKLKAKEPQKPAEEKKTLLKMKIPKAKSPPAPALPPLRIKKPPIKLKVSKPSKPNTSTSSASSNTSAGTAHTKKTPRIIRVKPTRIPGDGYDSEDSEAEDDPLIEEAIVLRLLPDAELDYVRHCVETGDFKNFHIKWKDRHRALIYINHSVYGAKLINLPNVIEAQKTIDKKNIFKTVDISQILLVVKKLNDESEIADIVVEENETSSDGITPPLKNILNNKNIPRLDYSHIEKLEAKVDELLRLDEEAEDTQFELIDPEMESTASLSPQRETSFVQQDDQFNFGPQDSSHFGQIDETLNPQDHVDDLEMELEQVLGEEDVDPQEQIDEEEGELLEEDIVEAAEDEDEEDDDDEDDDDDDDDSDNEQGVSRKVEVDEDEQHNALVRDEIAELESTIEQNKLKLEKTHNPLLRNRFIDGITKLEKELENKKRQLKTGEDKTNRKNNAQKDDDEDDEEEEEGDGDNDGDEDDEDDAGLFEEDDEEDEEDEANDNDEDDEEGATGAPEQEMVDAENDDGDLEELFG